LSKNNKSASGLFTKEELHSHVAVLDSVWAHFQRFEYTVCVCQHTCHCVTILCAGILGTLGFLANSFLLVAILHQYGLVEFGISWRRAANHTKSF